MEKTTIQRIGIGAVMIGVFGYTLNYLLKQVRKLVNTEFTFSKAKINDISFQKISITLFWKVVNKSDISFTVSNQDFDIYLNDIFVKKVGYTAPVEVKANTTSFIPTYIVFEPIELTKIGIGNALLFTNKENWKDLNLLCKGTFTIKTSIAEVKKFPFQFEDNIHNITNY
jgi:LEA14-like dessication related protein